MRKKDVVALIFFCISSLFLVLCWLFLLFRWSNTLIFPVEDIFVRAFAWLNLFNYPDHGGHYVPLHSLVWLVNLLIAFTYGGTVNYLVSKKLKVQKGIFILQVFIFLISFTIYFVTTLTFFSELGSFAYNFFFPRPEV